MKPALYILAGGRSSRFGSDKARALFRGRPLIVGLAEDLASATLGTTVVASTEGAYRDLGLETIGDRQPGLGPLGGLVTALDDLPNRHPGSEWLLLAACDLVEVDPAWVTALMSHTESASAVAFRGPDGWEPVFALYGLGLAAEVAARIDTGERSLQGLLDATGAAALPVPTGYRQIITPADLEGLEGLGEG